MRDKHQRGTSLLRTFEQNIDDFFASGTVKISGWLIGQKNAGFGGNGAGNRNALLFAARHLIGKMRQAVPQSNRPKRRRRTCFSIGTASQLKRD